MYCVMESLKANWHEFLWYSFRSGNELLQKIILACKKNSDGISRIQPTFAAKTSTIHGEHMSFILTELKTIIAQIWKFLPVKFEFCYNLKNKLKWRKPFFLNCGHFLLYQVQINSLTCFTHCIKYRNFT